MLGALESQGTAVGVLADSLLRAATSAKYRRGLMGKNLVLVSPFSPEAQFNVGNAMAATNISIVWRMPESWWPPARRAAAPGPARSRT